MVVLRVRQCVSVRVCIFVCGKPARSWGGKRVVDDCVDNAREIHISNEAIVRPRARTTMLMCAAIFKLYLSLVANDRSFQLNKIIPSVNADENNLKMKVAK